jgi:GH25 family lysozyme M1 (1,4-beta-N-acetylmuramidase)
MKRKHYSVPLFFITLFLILGCVRGIQAKAATTIMPAAGNANLKAIDISHYDVPQDSNGNYLYSEINWPTLSNNVNVIYIKATEGCTITDQFYQQYAASAKSVHISYGFYHYFRPNASLSVDKQQADYFFNAIKDIGFDCVPVLDVEESSPTPTSPSLSKSQLDNAVEAFADEFKSKSGLDIMIYSFPSFVNEYFDSSLSHYKLWIADWTSSGPIQNSIWSSWDMWQNSDDATVAGMPDIVDSDVATSNVFLSTPSGKTWIDSPSGTESPGNITVSGWAISHYGVSRVDIYVDGKDVGSVPSAKFSQRPDVETAFAGGGYYEPSNSGYNYTIPDGTLLGGTHVVTVAEIDDRGNAVWSASQKFTLNMPNPQICLDQPNGTYTNNISVSGWAISHYGISRADIYVDGKVIGSVPGSSFTARTDIEQKFGSAGYNDLNQSGFSYVIPNEALAGGAHTIQVAAIDNSGHAVWSAAKKITLNVPKPQINLDAPNGSYTGNIAVSGWAISHFGVSRVDVYVDGKNTASVPVSSFTTRSDVERIFGTLGYNDLAQSGFSYMIPSENLAGGTHIVQVAELDNKGNAVWSATKKFTVVVPPEKINLDTPSGNYAGNITVSGWAISHFGVSRVDIYVDGTCMASVPASVFIARTDVESIFVSKGYSDLAQSGFVYTIPQGELAMGIHSVRVAEIDNGGHVLWSSQNNFQIVS